MADDGTATANLVGSLDRGHKPTRMQQQEKEERGFVPNQTQQVHKRGQSTAVGGGQQVPVSSIQQTAKMDAINITNVKQ